MKGVPNLAQTAAIILAAGTSSRMGKEKNKLLLPLSERPVLAHVLEAVLNSQARPIVLVLGHQAEEVKAHIQTYVSQNSLTVIENPDYHLGMSTSMQTGLRTLLANRHQLNPQNAIFLLGDQPLITANLINRLLTLQEQTGKRIVLPQYQGQRGNPVLFSLDLAPELMQIQGDEGGRSLLKRHPEEIATLEVETQLANIDVDTWEAYLKVRYLKEQAHFWLNYSQQLSAAIRYHEALNAIERALALDPENVEIWYAKGTYLAMIAEYQQALSAFEHALELSPNFAPAWDGKAWALGILGQREEALEAVNRALEIDPEYFDAVKRKRRLEAM
jgi:molybdenum cofactor cytidylyltransferase